MISTEAEEQEPHKSNISGANISGGWASHKVIARQGTVVTQNEAGDFDHCGKSAVGRLGLAQSSRERSVHPVASYGPGVEVVAKTVTGGREQGRFEP